MILFDLLQMLKSNAWKDTCQFYHKGSELKAGPFIAHRHKMEIRN